MPRPRRMATPAASDRAIVRATTMGDVPVGEVVVVEGCPCGCQGPDACITITENPIAVPEHTLSERIALSPIKQGDLQGLSIADMIFEESEARMSKVDKEVQSLIDLAVEQGWEAPVLEGTKLKWTNPEGGCVTTPTRVVGRGLQNLRTQLRRLGLEIESPQKKAEVIDLTEPAPDPATDPLAGEPEAGDPAQDPFAALGVLTAFVQAHQTDESEWSGLCESLEADKERLQAERDECIALLDQIRTALTTTAPWAALPTIAALLGLTEEKSA